jgi:hypothetical protein
MTVKDCKEALENFETGFGNILAEHGKFVLSKTGLSEKRNIIVKEYEQSKDNLFSSIFKFRLENFHSEMLRQILDKNTQEIGSDQYLKMFMQILNKINPLIKEHIFTENVSVECEIGKTKSDGRIDIFIYDDKYALIIENKINHAPDQPNQLAKYFRYAKSEGKEIIAIVYIPLHENKMPPIQDYADEFQKYIAEIREKLIVLPALNRKYPEKDIAHGFLDACLELPDNTDKQKYILSQYAKLLKSFEGENKMTAEVDMELLAELYKDKKSISTVENITGIWKNREYLLGRLLLKVVRENLTGKLGFTVDSEDENGLYKGINDNFSLCFYSNPDDNLYYLGFWSDGKLKGGLKNKLLEIFHNVTPETYFGNAADWDEPEKWLVKQFFIGEYKEPFDDICDYFLGRYKLLETKVKSLT